MESMLHVACAKCGTVNRVPADRVPLSGQPEPSEQARCGRCGSALLPATPMPLHATAFEHFIARTELPVIVDFWAPWCGPCRMMAPMFEEAARLRPDWRFAKVDTEMDPGTAQRHGIRSIPTLAVFVGGREIARTSGAMHARQLLAWADAELSRAGAR